MDSPIYDSNSNKILTLTNIGDYINKKNYYAKLTYEKSNADIENYYYKCLWGLRRYSETEYITKYTLFASSCMFNSLILIVGFMLLFFNEVTFGLFSNSEFFNNVEWFYLIIIFSMECLRSYKSNFSINKDKKLNNNFDILLNIVKEGATYRYFYLLIFGFAFFWFFVITVVFIYIMIDGKIWFDASIDINSKILALTTILVSTLIALNYIINMKNIILNFVIKDLRIPKHSEFFSIFVLLLPMLFYIEEEKFKYYIFGLLLISYFMVINYIYRKYITNELIPISKNTEIIFGIIGVILIVLLTSKDYIFLSIFLIFPLSLKIIQKTISFSQVNIKNKKKEFIHLWNFYFYFYISSSLILIIIVIGLILSPNQHESIILKISLIFILLLMLIMLMMTNTIRKISQKKEIEIIIIETNRIPLLWRICGVDGPFLKES